MKRSIVALVFAFFITPVFAQSVTQSGSVTAGHAAYWVSNGVIADAGTSANPKITSLGVVNNGGQAICVDSALPTSVGYNQICLSASTTGGSKISAYAFGTATNPGITFDINGSVQGFPAVTLPVVSGHSACFSGTTGLLIDCGTSPLLSTLAHTHIFVGNASNLATDFGTLATFSDNGTLTLTTAPSTTASGLASIQVSPSTGSAAGRLNFNSINVTNQYGTTGGTPDPYFSTAMATALSTKMTIGGSNLKGFQVGHWIQVDHSLGNSDIGTADVIGEAIGITTSNNMTGHGLYGHNLAAWVRSGGHPGHLVGYNAEVGIFTGGAAETRIGIRLQSEGQVSATTRDAAISTWADTPGGDVGWKDFISLNESGTRTISTTGDFANASAFPTFTIANILNFPTATVSGSILSFPHVILAGSGLLTLNSGTVAAPAAFAPPSTILQLVQDGASNITLDSFGGGGSVLIARAANGSMAVPTTIVNATSIGGVGFSGYNSSTYSGVSGGMFGQGTQTWTAGANGTRLSFTTTPNGSTTAGEALGIEQDKQASFKGNIGIQSAAFTNQGIGFDNTAAGGRHWDLLSLATGTTLGTAGSFIIFDETGAFTRLQLNSSGSLRLPAYGVGLLVSDASGNITAGGLTVGTTTIASGTTTRVLFDNAGVLGEYTISGTGNVCMTTNCSMTTPALGTPSAVVLTNATGLPIGGITGLGTGVATALAVNIGTAGSFVVNGGALGSPSSAGTLPAHTLGGTISGGGNQINNVIIGTTTPLAGFFTTLSATTSLTSPLHYGGTTASSTLTLASTSGAGTTDSIKLQTGSQVYRGGINTSGQWIIGPDVTPPLAATKLLINANTVAPAAAPEANSILSLVGADAAAARVYVQSFGTGVQPGIAYVGARGTAASPTATQSGDVVGFNFGKGYGTNQINVNAGAGFNMTATENNSNTASGTKLDIYTTPNTTAIVSLAASFQASGGLSIGTATDPGIGGLQVNAQMFAINITQTSAAQTGTVCWTTGTGKFTVDTTVGCLASIGVAKNIVSRPLASNALDIVSALSPVSFRYKRGWGDSGRYEQFGLIAEEVATVDERLVGRDPEGTLQGVRYQELTAVLVGAVKQLRADNDNLRAEIEEIRVRR